MTKEELKFESAMKRLEKIMAELGKDGLGIDETIALFDEAMTLVKECDRKLSLAEEKIQKLMKDQQGKILTDEHGNPQKEPF